MVWIGLNRGVKVIIKAKAKAEAEAEAKAKVKAKAKEEDHGRKIFVGLKMLSPYKDLPLNPWNIEWDPRKAYTSQNEMLSRGSTSWAHLAYFILNPVHLNILSPRSIFHFGFHEMLKPGTTFFNADYANEYYDLG